MGNPVETAYDNAQELLRGKDLEQYDNSEYLKAMRDDEGKGKILAAMKLKNPTHNAYRAFEVDAGKIRDFVDLYEEVVGDAPEDWNTPRRNFGQKLDRIADELYQEGSSWNEEAIASMFSYGVEEDGELKFGADVFAENLAQLSLKAEEGYEQIEEEFRRLISEYVEGASTQELDVNLEQIIESFEEVENWEEDYLQVIKSTVEGLDKDFEDAMNKIDSIESKIDGSTHQEYILGSSLTREQIQRLKSAYESESLDATDTIEDLAQELAKSQEEIEAYEKVLKSDVEFLANAVSEVTEIADDMEGSVLVDWQEIKELESAKKEADVVLDKARQRDSLDTEKADELANKNYW